MTQPLSCLAPAETDVEAYVKSGAIKNALDPRWLLLPESLAATREFGRRPDGSGWFAECLNSAI